MQHTVTIANHAFSPPVLKIKSGDILMWHNNDGVRHSARSDGNIPFDTGLISKDQDSSLVTLTGTVGTQIDYYCEPHPHMQAKIVIT